MVGGKGGVRAHLWNKDFFCVLFARMLYSTVFAMFTATLATYCIDFLETDTDLAGVIVGIFIIAGLVGRVVVGRYTDFIGRRRLVLIAAVVSFASSLAYLLPLGVEALIILRVVHGLAFGVSTNTLTVIAVGYIPSGHLGEGLGYYSIAAVIAAAIGPFVGIFILQYGSYIMLFGLSAMFSFAALIFCLLLNIKESPLSVEHRNKIKAHFRLKDFFEIKAVPMGVIAMLTAMCYGGVTSFAYIYAETSGLGTLAPVFFLIYSLVLFITRPPIGRLYDKKGPDAVFMPGFVVFSLSFVLLGFCAGNAVAFLFAAALLAVGYGGLHSAAQVYAIQSAGKKKLSVATSTYYAFSDVGLGMGPVTMGLLQEYVGYSRMYQATAFFVLILFIGYIVMRQVFKHRASKVQNAAEDQADSQSIEQ